MATFAVNAYGVYCNITFPLIVKVFKPKGTLLSSDKYQTKIELAAEIITELIKEGFNIKLVLADSLYGEASAFLSPCVGKQLAGESSQFLSSLAEHNLDYVVAIRNNHAVWLPSDQSVRANKWCKFERIFSNQKSETRYIKEIIHGKKRAITYWQITTDPEILPENSTTFVMTNLKGNLKKTIGDLYGLRTWTACFWADTLPRKSLVEYGFRQCKQELGWTDYRFTHFKDIERWWEIIFCAYTMISLSSPAFLAGHRSHQIQTESQKSNFVDFSNH